MGFRSETGDISTARKTGFLIPSAAEGSEKFKATKEATREGAKASAIAAVISSVATLGAVRVVPWAKKNINYTGQALIISAASIAAFFITADQTILERAKGNTNYDKQV